MHQILPTLLFLAILLAAVGLVRSRWPTFSPRRQRCLLTAALLAILLVIGGAAVHWKTVSDRLNTTLCWAALAGYLLLLAVHSLNRPRWLTSLTSVILAIPILSASVLLPLGNLLYPATRRIAPLGHHLYASWQPFSEPAAAGAGFDVEVLSRPPWLPFLQHSRLGGRFFNERCNAPATQIVLEPDAQSVFVHCPPWPNAPDTDPAQVLRLH